MPDWGLLVQQAHERAERRRDRVKFLKLVILPCIALVVVCVIAARQFGAFS